MVKLSLKIFIFILMVSLTKPVLAIDKPAELVNPAIGDPNKRLQVNTLVDTPYKLAANFFPALVLRALIESKFYRNKRKAFLERTIYLSSNEAGTVGFTKKPLELEHATVNLEVKGVGFLGRDIYASGKVNNLDLNFKSEMRFKITKVGDQKIRSTLGGIDYINVEVKTDGKAESNDVAGSFLGRDVKYHTQLRDTSGKLGKFDFKLHVQGVHDKPLYEVFSYGQIDEYKIEGFGRAISPDIYAFEERYGPLIIKSTLKVFD